MITIMERYCAHGMYTHEFKAYDYSTDTWESLTNPGFNGGGIALAYDNNNGKIFAHGQYTHEFKAYDYNTDSWESLTNPGFNGGDGITSFIQNFNTRLVSTSGGQYSSIQKAIDASSNSDTVLVSPGTYTENINFNGKNIVVGSLFMTTGILRIYHLLLLMGVPMVQLFK